MMIFAAGILSAQTRVDNSRAMDSILVKDWVPDSSLVVPETNIPKARFSAIDVHVHARGNLGDTRESLSAWVQIMDEAGVEKMIVLSEATGAEFDRLSDLYQKNYPDRFQLWCGLDEQDFEKPDYPERAAAELERCYRKGGRGVGELSDKGWGIMGGVVAAYGHPIELPRERRMHLDDPRLDLFWNKCAQLKIPVSLHVADHPSAWRPPDNHQERSPRYQTYNQYGSDVPSYEELLARRDRLLARHPDTTFIAVHFSNQGNDLSALSQALDRFPNLYVDISARDYEMGRQPRAAARFLEKYKDRVLYGSDQTPATGMYRSWWRLMESSDEYIPGPVWWRLYGLSLQDGVLEAVYRGNARRILNWK
jgi:predicted TIM-barrel fold metal-dependent hydrolase